VFLSYSLYQKHISWPTQPAIQWVTGDFALGGGGRGRAKRSDPEADHSHKGADQPGNYPGRQPIKGAKTSLQYSEIWCL